MPKQRSHGALALAFLAALVVPGGSAAVQASPLRVEFLESKVRVQGVTPGERAVFWWLAQGTNGFTPWTSRLTEVVLDEDRDGVVSVPFEGGVPESSLWVVVDLASGEATLASPLDGPLRRIDPPRGEAATVPGRGEVEDERRSLELLLVRPGTDAAAGAWAGGASDGGAGDGDGERNGRIRARLDRLEPLEEDGLEPPRALRTGDVVVVGNAEELVFWVRRVSADPPRGESAASGEGVRPCSPSLSAETTRSATGLPTV